MRFHHLSSKHSSKRQINKLLFIQNVMEWMTAEQVILMLMEVAIFTSVLTLGFKATEYRAFCPLSSPQPVHSNVSRHVRCGACCDRSNLGFSAAACRCENRRDTLGDLTGCNNLAAQHARSGGETRLMFIPY